MKHTPVTDADDGIRLDRWFARHYPAVSHGQLQKALRSKLIRVDNKRAEASQRLEAGQIIKHPEFEAKQPEKSPRHAGTKASAEKTAWVKSLILYENDDLIVLNKPAGMATQGGSGLGNKHIDALLPLLGGAKLVHRLDKDTSGVLLLARDARTAARLTKAFASKEALKTYWALVKGVPSPTEGLIDAPLAKITRGGQEIMAVVSALEAEEERRAAAQRKQERWGARPGRSAPDEGRNDEDKTTPQKIQGQYALTEYRVVEKLSRRLSWLELSPLTGRTHQLRVHCLHIGHPIYGDGKYAGRDAFPEGLNLPNQLHLHARRLVIPGVVDVTAPLPPHMEKSWEMLGLSLTDHR